MAIYCFHCSTKIESAGSARFGRKDTCPKCDSDIHVCLNCRHYDESSYNQCREPQADRVLDKDKSNFCEFFSPADGPLKKEASDKKAAMKKLDELFK